MALMSSGMNGQNFAFNGYLPIDKHDKRSVIKDLERHSYERNQSQLFIETPYRNNKLLEDLVATLHPATRVCVACDITLNTEFIKTKTAGEWKKNSVDLHKRPTLWFNIRRIIARKLFHIVFNRTSKSIRNTLFSVAS